MIRFNFPLYAVLLVAIPAVGLTQTKPADLKLWYDKPANIWEEALPLGNGRTGAIVFGRVNKERIQLNDNTLWSGFPDAGNNPKGPAMLPQLRKAVLDGDYTQAAAIWKQNFQGTYSARYVTMADLFLDFKLKDSAATTYRRELDLGNALHTVTYTISGVRYKRETLVSYPDKVMAIRITASRPNAISFAASITSKLRFAVSTVKNNQLILKGKAPKHVAHRASEPLQVEYDEKEGTNFEVHVRVNAEGGHTTASGGQVLVSGATAVTICLSNGTSYNGPDKSPGLEGKDPSVEAKANLVKAALKPFSAIKTAHIADHKRLFNRVSFTLSPDPALTLLPTNVRLSRQGQQGNDQGLQALYYQFGRYLVIAGSRPGSQATTLQGLWNDHVQPPWGSNYTVNANTQMNYWLAESTNLSELHEPLFSLIDRLAVHGATTARVNYGIQKGWVLHHNTDIWAKTSPAGGYDWDPRSAARWSAWPMGGAWLSTHVYDHYLFTGDKEFLRKRAYPLMKGAAEFMLAWLVEDKNGKLITVPSTSPENIFKKDGKEYEVSMATTMDMSIIRELFMECIEASKALQTDATFRATLEQAQARLYPYHIGRYGQLQEWFEDLDDPKDTHRHLSHLFGLYPGTQISVRQTPELASAAKQSLIHRGDVSTGWSMAWKINWWARLQDGDHALRILKAGLTLIDPAKTTELPAAPLASANAGAPQLTATQQSGGGTYPNLFDAHPPFQIDGNFGATAGITEMLLQSHTGEVSLLPALPAEWKSGQIRGIRARGNFTLSMVWKNNKLSKAVIFSGSGGNLRLRTTLPVRVLGHTSVVASGENPNQLMIKQGPMKYEKNPSAELQQLNDRMGYIIDFKTTKGRTYTILPR